MSFNDFHDWIEVNIVTHRVHNQINRTELSIENKTHHQWQCRNCGDKWWTNKPTPPEIWEYPTSCNDTVIKKVMKA